MNNNSIKQQRWSKCIVLNICLNKSELDKNDHVGDPNGDHWSKCAPFNCEETQACHWSCLVQLLKNENRTKASRKLKDFLPEQSLWFSFYLFHTRYPESFFGAQWQGLQDSCAQNRYSLQSLTLGDQRQVKRCKSQLWCWLYESQINQELQTKLTQTYWKATLIEIVTAKKRRNTQILNEPNRRLQGFPLLSRWFRRYKLMEFLGTEEPSASALS